VTVTPLAEAAGLSARGPLGGTEDAAHTRVTGIIWGVTVGLAAAHWFAFRVSARLVGAGTVRSPDVRLGGAQLLGAVVVAVLASVPIVLFPPSMELEATTVCLAAFIAVAGYAVARAGGAARARATVYAMAVLVVGIAIAELKNVLAGH
jgi:hypothetical protein